MLFMPQFLFIYSVFIQVIWQKNDTWCTNEKYSMQKINYRAHLTCLVPCNAYTEKPPSSGPATLPRHLRPTCTGVEQRWRRMREPLL